MAHYAEVLHGTVQRVVVVSNDVITVGGVEDEQRGVDHLDAILPTTGAWRQTSYSGSVRHNFAGIGYTYDPDGDAFVAPQPHTSWSLDDSFEWQPPVPYPFDPTTDPDAISTRLGLGDDGNLVAYDWNEESLAWVAVDAPV